VKPTIFADVKDDMKIATDEVRETLSPRHDIYMSV